MYRPLPILLYLYPNPLGLNMRRAGGGRNKTSSSRLACPLVLVSFVLFVFYYNVLSGMNRADDYSIGGQFFTSSDQDLAPISGE